MKTAEDAESAKANEALDCVTKQCPLRSSVSSVVFISIPTKKGAIRSRPRLCNLGRLKPYLPPNPADCMDCREISEVEAMPCMRSLKSSALEAFSSAVS